MFMKGTPDAPQCGFSRAVCQILDVNVSFRSTRTLHTIPLENIPSVHPSCTSDIGSALTFKGVERKDLKAFNCLADNELREGIKEYR